MAQTTFQVDKATLALIAELKEKLNVTSSAAVLRKSLALARVAAQHADSNDMLTIIDPVNSERVKVAMKA